MDALLLEGTVCLRGLRMLGLEDGFDPFAWRPHAGCKDLLP